MNHDLWQKCFVFFPRRDAKGRWLIGAGQMWRRWNGRHWEYQQDAETEDEFLGRA